MTRPTAPAYVVGIGMAGAATAADLSDAVDAALGMLGATRSAVVELATRVELTVDPRVMALELPIRGFDAVQLDAVVVPNPSESVAAAVCTRSVAEAAALLAAGESGVLVVAKQRSAFVTVAIALSE